MDLLKIKERRKKLNMTQIDVAVAVGVSPEAFRNWERGAIKPNEENMKKLIEVLRGDDIEISRK